MEAKNKNNLNCEENIRHHLKYERYDTESLITETSDTQIEVENKIKESYDHFIQLVKYDPLCPELYRPLHIEYLISGLCKKPGTYEGLDCSRPWLCYWITHSLILLNYRIDDETQTGIIDFLSRCQCEEGGFGGGPGQLPHLAPTYAAVNTLCTLGTPSALQIINRSTLLRFLWSVRVGDGSFYMHVGGEIDVRSVYCALVVAKLTNIFTEALFENSAEWIVRCQTYEGGFSSIPGMEAHGGYSFCAIASLSLLSCQELCDLKSVLRWTSNRQMKFEGGFQGRTNKLVDSCYSFWQGATVSLIFMSLISESNPSSGIMDDSWLFNHDALQEYVLICCQYKLGGISDKPLVSRDHYHTCYALSGLSLAQHLPSGKTKVTGPAENLLEPINPVYNLGVESLRKSKEYFSQFSKSPSPA